jgi:hypothetical protein
MSLRYILHKAELAWRENKGNHSVGFAFTTEHMFVLRNHDRLTGLHDSLSQVKTRDTK